MKNSKPYRYFQIALFTISLLSSGCSDTTENKTKNTEKEAEVLNETPETKEELWSKTISANNFSAYLEFLEKHPNDTEALKNLIKTNEFKNKYGAFLSFFDNLKGYKNDFSEYFANFSKNSCSMNDENINSPYTEDHFIKYQHKKLCKEAEVMSFPSIGSTGVVVSVDKKGISWLHQSVGAGASVMIYFKWQFENESLVIVNSEIEIDYFNEGEEAMVENTPDETSDCKPKFKIEGINDAKGFYKNSDLNASWTIHFAENDFVIFHTKNGVDDEVMIVDKIEKISDCKFGIIINGIEGKHAPKWQLRYNVGKNFYDLITLEYEEELDAWLDIAYEGSLDNG